MKKLLLGLTLALSSYAAQASNPVWLEGMTDAQHTVKVWRSETCGCCKAWIDHLEAHNFHVIDTPTQDMASVKAMLDVPASLQSCHTAQIGDLTIEGHVPAQDIKKALNSFDAPDLIAVPGMPAGSPGMDMSGMGQDDFSVIAVQDGRGVEWARYEDY